MKIKYPLIILITLLCNLYTSTLYSKTIIADFSKTKLSDWQHKSFVGYTHYQVVKLNNRMVLKAESQQQASGLIKKQRIDLNQTPFLNWRWRIENRLKKHDEQKKSGDDYAARIYIIIDGGWKFWQTLALNYVWANTSKKNQSWPNAYAGKNAIMLALRSSQDKTKTWHQEKRNVLNDIKEQLGKNIRYIDAIAIMTDTDDAQDQATAYYGDIYFTAK